MTNVYGLMDIKSILRGDDSNESRLFKIKKMANFDLQFGITRRMAQGEQTVILIYSFGK